MRQIAKFRITERLSTLTLPARTALLRGSLAFLQGELCIWGEIDPDEKRTVKAKFAMLREGDQVDPKTDWFYVGSAHGKHESEYLGGIDTVFVSEHLYVKIDIDPQIVDALTVK